MITYKQFMRSGWFKPKDSEGHVVCGVCGVKYWEQAEVVATTYCDMCMVMACTTCCWKPPIPYTTHGICRSCCMEVTD